MAAVPSFLMPVNPIPVDVQPLVDSFNQLNTRLGEINTAVRDLKKSMGYKQTSDQLKETKERLYVYMATMKIDKLGSIGIQKVKPASVKKEERNVKLAATVEEVLDDELGEDQASEVAPVLVQALLKK